MVAWHRVDRPLDERHGPLTLTGINALELELSSGKSLYFGIEGTSRYGEYALRIGRRDWYSPRYLGPLREYYDRTDISFYGGFQDAIGRPIQAVTAEWGQWTREHPSPPPERWYRFPWKLRIGLAGGSEVFICAAWIDEGGYLNPGESELVVIFDEREFARFAD